MADLLNLPANATGYIVKNVGGDIGLEALGHPMKPTNIARVREELAKLHSGDTFQVTVLRAGRIIQLTGKAP